MILNTQKHTIMKTFNQIQEAANNFFIQNPEYAKGKVNVEVNIYDLRVHTIEYWMAHPDGENQINPQQYEPEHGFLPFFWNKKGELKVVFNGFETEGDLEVYNEKVASKVRQFNTLCRAIFHTIEEMVEKFYGVKNPNYDSENWLSPEYSNANELAKKTNEIYNQKKSQVRTGEFMVSKISTVSDEVEKIVMTVDRPMDYETCHKASAYVWVKSKR